MIFTDRTIIVQKGTSSINDTIVLYRGDREVEVRFTLNEGSPFKFGSGASPNIIEKTEAAYGQLIIKRPNDLPAIFSEIAPTNGGKIVFTITAEMIDEITEVGNYTFQIRLLDESRNSRATLPEVVNGIEIREPIATEDVTDTNEVEAATVGYALTTAGTQEDTFDSQGNYNKTTWGTGDRITAAKLNKIEAGIDGVNKKVASGGTSGEGMTPEQANQLSTAYQHSQAIHAPSDAEANVQVDWNEADTTSDAYIKNKPTNLVTTDDIPTVPTKTSELTNDSDFVNSTFVANKIAEASLSGGVEDYITDYKDGSVNVFNKNNRVKNCFWSAETLQLERFEGIDFSNFIKCEETDTIRIKVNNIGSNYHVVFKNKEGHVFDGIFYVTYPNEIITITDIPKDAYYFGVIVYDVDVNAMMITINNEMPSSYQEYKPSKLELSDNLISAIKSINNSNDDNSSDDDYLANRLLVWEEDFSGNEIDRTSWINLCRKDGSGNNQLEYNTARSKNCRIVNNQLIIEARREHYKGKGWTSANLNTSNLHEFQYGRIEAKIKLPNSHGIWPAFWMMGANADLSTDENDEFIYTGLDWPTCGEIDIFEYWGRNSGGRLAGALNYASDTNNTHGSKEIYGVLEGQNNYDPTQWHIYGIEWTEDKMDFLVDNEVKGTVSLEQFTLSNGFNPFRLPHYIILNVAVDIADDTTDKNNLMFVDWVRVYAPENVESYVNPTGITLNTNTVTLNVGDERVPSLQANILPIDASEKTVIWESSNSDIVVVGGGSLTAKKQGTCEIIARTLNGYEARCVVTVN